MDIDKIHYEANSDLVSYMEELLNPDAVEEKTKIETQYEPRLNLGLYIEGLLNTDEAEVEIELKKEIKLKTKEKNGEQSQIPSWGEIPFECLLIESAGMNLMVPTMSVSYIKQISNKNIMRLPSGIKAFRGMLTLRERSVAIIDLFTLISGNASVNNQQTIQVDTNHTAHVLVIENGDYALACDDVCKIIMLTTESVRWNKGCFNNPTFAGVVPDYLCPIINVDYLQQQVSEMSFLQ